MRHAPPTCQWLRRSRSRHEREVQKELLELQAVTVFTVDGELIFPEGHTYLQDLRFHIIPNRWLTAVHLVGSPAETVFSTMKSGMKLVVTTACSGGFSHPMRLIEVGKILNKSGWSGFERNMALKAATNTNAIHDDYHSL